MDRHMWSELLERLDRLAPGGDRPPIDRMWDKCFLALLHHRLPADAAMEAHEAVKYLRGGWRHMGD